MLAEIREQPEVLERILDEGWDEILSATRVLRQGNLRSVMIAARGTSDNAALYAKYLFEVLLGVPAALSSPSSFTLYESEMNLEGVLWSWASASPAKARTSLKRSADRANSVPTPSP
jgi:glucosamine--fructose-6-phosphate aminotransferase (isomerizing)